MVGHNFRLGEIESAIGIEQLKKLDYLIKHRQGSAERLSKGLNNLKGLQTPIIKPGYSHAFYIYPLIINTEEIGISRDRLHLALEAEGVPGLISGYVNVHLLPMYQDQIAYGSKGFPWSSDICQRDVDYSKGICPVAEELYDESFMGIEICRLELTNEDVDLIIEAFKKVWNNFSKL